MNTNIAHPVALNVNRLIKVPRERVFAAWTTPADIMKWFGGDTCRPLSAKIDLRVGGEYRFRIKTETKGELDLWGIYREVKAPSKLVFTWNWSGNCGGMELDETVVTVDLLDRNGSTEVQITHEPFPTAEARDQHALGWNACLEKMEKLS